MEYKWLILLVGRCSYLRRGIDTKIAEIEVTRVASVLRHAGGRLPVIGDAAHAAARRLPPVARPPIELDRAPGGTHTSEWMLLRACV